MSQSLLCAWLGRVLAKTGLPGVLIADAGVRRNLVERLAAEDQACADFMAARLARPTGVRALGDLDRILASRAGRSSFSQAGEDLIVEFLFRILGIRQPSYLDLGAYDPWDISNTARLYMLGSRGINVEPNPTQFRRFVECRDGDINLNIGIAASSGTLTYMVMDAPTLNTFSEALAESYVREHNHRIVDRQRVPVVTVAEVLERHCGGAFPDFLSVDMEGADALVVEAIGSRPRKPIVVCLETISYSRGGKGVKDLDLVRSLTSLGYLHFADTFINSIFVQEDLWRGVA